MKKYLILAAIVLIGLLAFCGCAELIEEDKSFVELNTWFFTSGIPNNCIKVIYPDGDAQIEMSASKGVFWVTALQEYAQKAIVSSGDDVFWHNGDAIIDIDYVDIIVRVDNNIVGYAVIKIVKGDNFDYNAEIIKSAIFPKLNNEYQKVTQKQVEKMLQALKK